MDRIKSICIEEELCQSHDGSLEQILKQMLSYKKLYNVILRAEKGETYNSIKNRYSLGFLEETDLGSKMEIEFQTDSFGCKYMRTDSGGGLTNKLLENGLIDEISLVISPCFVGNKEKQLFDNLLLSEKVNLELQGTENAEHGCLSLRYAVKNKD